MAAAGDAKAGNRVRGRLVVAVDQERQTPVVVAAVGHEPTVETC